MKTISKEFYSKIVKTGCGILDTKTYRYVIDGPCEVKRIKIEYLDTTESLVKSNWETVGVRE